MRCALRYRKKQGVCHRPWSAFHALDWCNAGRFGGVETGHANAAPILRFKVVQCARAARYMQTRHATGGP